MQLFGYALHMVNDTLTSVIILYEYWLKVSL